MAEHSPEPWGYTEPDKPDDPDGYCEIFAAADRPSGQRIELVATWVAEQYNETFACYGIRQVDARRIVACVKACKGYDTRALELFGDQLPKHPGNKFIEFCRHAYRAMYSQQKHLDADNSSQMGHNRDALNALSAAFKLAGLRL